MVKVADTLEGVQSGIIDIGGFCFCFEPSNLPLHAFQVMLPFGTMDPVMSVKVARAVYDKVPYMSKVFEDKFQPEADRADRRQRLQPRHHLRVEQRRRPQGRKLAGAGPQSEMAGVRRRGAGAVARCPRPTPRCRPASTTAGSCSRRATSTSSSTRVGKYYTEIGFGAITWHGLTINSARWSQAAEGRAGHHPRGRQGVRGEDRHGEQGELSQADRRAQGARARSCASCRTRCAQDWAKSLASGWPQKAKELDSSGLPGTQVLEIALEGGRRQRPQVAGALQREVMH